MLYSCCGTLFAREGLEDSDLDATTFAGDFDIEVKGRPGSSSSEGPSQTVSCFFLGDGLDNFPVVVVSCGRSNGTDGVLVGHAVAFVCLGLSGDTSSLTML